MRPQDHRQYSFDCLRLANTTSEPNTKAVLVDMARAWLKLAEQGTSFHPKTYGHLTLVSDSPSRPHNPKRNCPGFDPRSKVPAGIGANVV
jgi:hypothetical protein